MNAHKWVILALLGLFTTGAVFSHGNGTVADTGARATYCAASNGEVATGTTGTTSIMYVWHPSSETKAYRFRWSQFHGSPGSGTGRYLLRVAGITAQNATPGGTAGVAVPADPANPASNATVIIGATGAPTRAAADLFTGVFGATDSVNVDLFPHTGMQAFTLPGGANAGFELRVEVTSALTGSAEIALWVCWTEE